jgi:hypothetical protein
VHVSGVNLQTVGLILMIVGGLGLVLGLYLATRARWWAPPRPPEQTPPRPPEQP